MIEYIWRWLIIRHIYFSTIIHQNQIAFHSNIRQHYQQKCRFPLTISLLIFPGNCWRLWNIVIHFIGVVYVSDLILYILYTKNNFSLHIFQSIDFSCKFGCKFRKRNVCKHLPNTRNQTGRNIFP